MSRSTCLLLFSFKIFISHFTDRRHAHIESRDVRSPSTPLHHQRGSPSAPGQGRGQKRIQFRLSTVWIRIKLVLLNSLKKISREFWLVNFHFIYWLKFFSSVWNMEITFFLFLYVAAVFGSGSGIARSVMIRIGFCIQKGQNSLWNRSFWVKFHVLKSWMFFAKAFCLNKLEFFLTVFIFSPKNSVC